MNFDLYKRQLEKWIEDYFNLTPHEDYKFIEPMLYSVNVGGKRIRPILMILTHKMYSDKLEEVLPFAAAIELIHTYSLIHDDLPSMDNDDLRRGKPTNHKVYGEAMAILAGDGLLNEAMIIMFKECLHGNEAKARVSHLIAESSSVRGMIKGQIIDMTSEGKALDEETLISMHRNKTGRLIEASILAGAILGGASEEDITLLSKFGSNLGLVFQVKDDILDVEGNEELMGKTKSDTVNNKVNFVTMYGIEQCKALCKELTEECYHILDNIEVDSNELREITDFLLKRTY